MLCAQGLLFIQDENLSHLGGNLFESFVETYTLYEQIRVKQFLLSIHYQ